jgi:four helix bundle protein
MTTTIETHKDMRLWSKAMDMTEAIYRLTCALPTDERFGLTAQMRRAAVSIPSNIAEGAARGTTTEFIRFVMIARGSLSELETQLNLVERLKLAAVPESFYEEVRILRQMLIALTRSLGRRKLST